MSKKRGSCDIVYIVQGRLVRYVHDIQYYACTCSLAAIKLSHSITDFLPISAKAIAQMIIANVEKMCGLLHGSAGNILTLFLRR